jgi:ornithine cyclodeaminase
MRSFDEAATRAGLPQPALIEALRTMFQDGCVVPSRHVHTLADAGGAATGTVLIMPAWRPGRHLGIKTVSVFPGNAARGLPGLHSVYTLFDAATGVPLAQMDGNTITTRRTVAASALAAGFLAREDSRRLLIVGAGRVAAAVAEAMCCVRPGIEQLEVWNHRPAGAQALAQALTAGGRPARAVDDLAGAVSRADIVSCATLSTSPLVRGAWLRPGTHLDLVGAFTPAMRECDGPALAASRVYVDTEEALAKAGDLLQAVDEGHFGAAGLQGTLAQLCRGERRGRRAEHEITLFKSVGTALEDLAAAELVWASA